MVSYGEKYANMIGELLDLAKLGIDFDVNERMCD